MDIEALNEFTKNFTKRWSDADDERAQAVTDKLALAKEKSTAKDEKEWITSEGVERARRNEWSATPVRGMFVVPCGAVCPNAKDHVDAHCGPFDLPFLNTAVARDIVQLHWLASNSTCTTRIDRAEITILAGTKRDELLQILKWVNRLDVGTYVGNASVIADLPITVKRWRPRGDLSNGQNRVSAHELDLRSRNRGVLNTLNVCYKSQTIICTEAQFSCTDSALCDYADLRIGNADDIVFVSTKDGGILKSARPSTIIPACGTCLSEIMLSIPCFERTRQFTSRGKYREHVMTSIARLKAHTIKIEFVDWAFDPEPTDIIAAMRGNHDVLELTFTKGCDMTRSVFRGSQS